MAVFTGPVMSIGTVTPKGENSTRTVAENYSSLTREIFQDNRH